MQRPDIFQHFAPRQSSEESVITSTLDALGNFDVIITYNGKSFDFPFLHKRAQKYNISLERTPFLAIDLYRWLKEYWPLASSLDNLKQTTVEKALNLEKYRKDIIDGATSVQYYAKYQKTGDSNLVQAILQHNADDVHQLARIADALSFLPYHKIAYECGFLIKGRRRNVLIENINLVGNKLIASGITNSGMMPISIFCEAYEMEYDPSDGSITLNIACESRDGWVFIDIESLPISTEPFTDSNYFRNGFLLISSRDDIQYKLACALVRSMIEVLMKEELDV